MHELFMHLYHIYFADVHIRDIPLGSNLKYHVYWLSLFNINTQAF